MKIIDYELIHNLSMLSEHNVVVYGTGVYGKKIANILADMKIKVSFFIQTIPTQTTFLDIKVISLKEFAEKNDCEEFLVIVASEIYYREMLQNLAVCDDVFVCTYYAVFISLFLNYEKIDLNDTLKNKIGIFCQASKKYRVGMFMNSHWRLRMYADILDNDKKIFVYQPGKVGSWTIYASNPSKMVHLHSMVDVYGINREDKELYEKIHSAIIQKPVKIITGVREPIFRDISAFFQNSEKEIYPLFERDNLPFSLYGDYYNNSELELTSTNVGKRLYEWKGSLQESYDAMCKITVENQSDEFSWFDYEIKALFGIDIFEYPFDKERGFSIIKRDNIEIFIYKCEKLSELENELRDFIGDTDFKISNSNVGAEKVYSYTYKEFKKNVLIDKEYFNYYYENPKWLNHFYTESEIVGFRKKWESRLRD